MFPPDLLRRNRVLKVETIERVCGALSARVDPSVSPAVLRGDHEPSKAVKERGTSILM